MEMANTNTSTNNTSTNNETVSMDDSIKKTPIIEPLSIKKEHNDVPSQPSTSNTQISIKLKKPMSNNLNNSSIKINVSFGKNRK